MRKNKTLHARVLIVLLFLTVLAGGCARQTRVVRIRVDSHPPATGPFRSPLKKPVLMSRFGLRKSWYHTGVDIRESPGGGNTVLAARSGVVIQASVEHRYGKIVAIRHSDGYVSRYAHLKRMLVHKGAQVQVGQKIGVVGMTGHATTPHLHFEILTPEGRFTNPAPFIGL